MVSKAPPTDLEKLLLAKGEFESLKQWAGCRLQECGWRDEIANHCRNYILQKGVHNVTSFEEIVESVKHPGRASVPNDIKADLLNRIRAFADENLPADTPP